MRRRGAWWWGPVFALLLAGAYVAAWRPARVFMTQQGAYPLLTAVSTERSDGFRLDPYRDGVMVFIVPERPGEPAAAFRAPGGMLFLLPALFLIGLYPFKPYWIYYGLYHLTLGAISLAAVAAGLAWGPAGFALYGFLNGYFLPATSLAVPAFVLARALRPRTTPAATA